MPGPRSSHCVVVANAARATIYALTHEPGQGGAIAPRLRETDRLALPERRALDSEVFTESRPGLRRGVRGGAGHGVDDHRQQHLSEWERQFASKIVDALLQRVQSGSIPRVVVAASPNMLGLLRPALERVVKTGAAVTDLPKDLTNLSPTDLYEHLASEGLLPSAA